ncbi:MAG: site-specific integrase [Proteobacteria bacterium]|nr:site-specific integrase [Pseudomonadota bacterium]MDE3208656.1 site-specific integrase [Pseudomonadota bacterium]
MGTLTKRGKTWRAQVVLKGVRKSATRDTKLEALQWIEETEQAILSGKHEKVVTMAFSELMDKYANEVSIKKKRGACGKNKDTSHKPPKHRQCVLIRDGCETHVGKWRDERLQSVSEGTVRREWNLLSSICTKAVKEWKLLAKNPFSDASKPKEPEGRDRLITQDEIDQLMQVFGDNIKSVMGRVGQVFLFALETGMRQGEICVLKAEDVYLDKRYLKIRGSELGAGKTRAARRDVPLLDKAITNLERVGCDFKLTLSQIENLFRKVRKKANIEDLHFHDSRHYAITMLARKLNILELGRMVGHRELKMLQRYYNESAEEIAKNFKLGRLPFK